MVSLFNINRLLPTGGLFVFDYWNGNAVMKNYSPVRELRKQRARPGDRAELSTQLDVVQQIAEVNFRFPLSGRWGQAGRPLHRRTSGPLLLLPGDQTYLELCGFELLHRSDFFTRPSHPMPGTLLS